MGGGEIWTKNLSKFQWLYLRTTPNSDWNHDLNEIAVDVGDITVCDPLTWYRKLRGSVNIFQIVLNHSFYNLYPGYLQMYILVSINVCLLLWIYFLLILKKKLKREIFVWMNYFKLLPVRMLAVRQFWNCDVFLDAWDWQKPEFHVFSNFVAKEQKVSLWLTF